MQSEYVSALFGIAGATVGGLTSLYTNWMTQHIQLRAAHRASAKADREKVFRQFISEAGRLYGDALSRDKGESSDLVRLYSTAAQMRLIASQPVLVASEKVMETIVAAYSMPARPIEELGAMARDGGFKFLLDFADACRVEISGHRDKSNDVETAPPR